MRCDRVALGDHLGEDAIVVRGGNRVRIERIGLPVPEVDLETVLPPSARFEAQAPIVEIGTLDSLHRLQESAVVHRSLDRHVRRLAAIDEVHVLALEDRHALVLLEESVDHRLRLFGGTDLSDPTAELVVDVGHFRYRRDRLAALHGDGGHLLEVAHVDAPPREARPGETTPVQRLQSGSLPVPGGRRLGHHDVALCSEDDQMTVHQDQAVAAGWPGSPVALAVRRVGTGQHLPAESVEVSVVVDRRGVVATQSLGPVELLDGERALRP